LGTDPGKPFSVGCFDFQRPMEQPAGEVIGVILCRLKLNPAQFIHFPYLLFFLEMKKGVQINCSQII
jgi:hypothetical protein